MSLKFKALLAVVIVGLSAPVFAESEAAAESALKAEVKIGTGLENREAVGVADSFTADTPQLTAWSRITGAAEPTTVTHVWTYNGTEIISIPLEIRSASFRTHSNITVHNRVGTFAVTVKDAAGNTLGSKSVEVTAAAAPAQ